MLRLVNLKLSHDFSQFVLEFLQLLNLFLLLLLWLLDPLLGVCNYTILCLELLLPHSRIRQMEFSRSFESNTLPRENAVNPFEYVLELFPRVRKCLVSLLLELFSEGLKIVVEIRISNLVHNLLLRQNIQIDSHERGYSELLNVN